MPGLMSPVTWEDGPDYFSSPERLQGEFIVRAYRFAPPTGSLESLQRLLLLFTAFTDFGQFRKNSRIKSSCLIIYAAVLKMSNSRHMPG